MTEEILPNLYRIEIPLPRNPLKFLNSYVIKNPDRNLIIDTGWNQEECMKAMQAGLKEIGIDLRKTDFFITHFHVDHMGLVPDLATDASKIFLNQPDADRFMAGIFWEESARFARLNGFPEDDLQAVLHGHPARRFRSDGRITFDIVKDRDTISVGDYAFTCVQTPGHSKGHMCLYEVRKKVFVAGDHILSDITPTIQSWSDEWNPLKEYLASLDKVYKLDIELVLPGHRSIIRDCKGRIQELKDHHQKRLDEIILILRNGSMNGFQVASQMSWDVIYDSWDLFPVSQKWFAAGEALAHLKYLEEEGIVKREIRDQTILFSLRVNT